MYKHLITIPRPHPDLGYVICPFQVILPFHPQPCFVCVYYLKLVSGNVGFAHFYQLCRLNLGKHSSESIMRQMQLIFGLKSFKPPFKKDEVHL